MRIIRSIGGREEGESDRERAAGFAPGETEAAAGTVGMCCSYYPTTVDKRCPLRNRGEDFGVRRLDAAFGWSTSVRRQFPLRRGAETKAEPRLRTPKKRKTELFNAE
jgi:hypothetical protein